MGFRIEHPQSLINNIQYHTPENVKILPPHQNIKIQRRKRLMFDKIIDELISEDKLGETWHLEMAPNHARYSYSSSKHGNENWAKNQSEYFLFFQIIPYLGFF